MRVDMQGTPTLDQARAVCAEMFPDFTVDVMAKAAGGGEQFEEWFMRALQAHSHEHFISAQYSIWQTLDDLLRARGVVAPSQLESWRLNQALFDLRVATTARMVGFEVSPAMIQRLLKLGFAPPSLVDFPALAYRMGLLYTRLAASEPVEWPELMRLARSVPLTAPERAAVDYARGRAGIWLQPCVDATGHVWTAERELVPLRRLLGDSMEQRRTAARELGESQRAMGVMRDTDRVIRTELANARSHGSWDVESKRWATDALLFRQTSRMACKDCLRLYKLPDGNPRLYLRAVLETLDAQGPNRGPQESWVAKIGATHPHCACSPWSRWLPELAPVFARRAPEYAEQMRTLKVFPLAEAA